MCRIFAKLFKANKSFINFAIFLSDIFKEYHLKRMSITFIQLIVNILIFLGLLKLIVF